MGTSLLIGIVSFVELWPPLVEFFLGGVNQKGLFGPPFLPPYLTQVTGRGDLEDSSEHPNSITKEKL